MRNFRFFLAPPALPAGRTVLLALLLLPAICGAQDSLRATPPPGVQFQFQLEPDDVLIVNRYQNISIQEPLQRLHREEKNRIVLKVTEKKEDRAHLEGFFYTYSRTRGRGREFRHEEKFFSRFSIGKRGDYEVPDRYIMPNLRSMPTFPDRSLAPGESWKESAMETMDFRTGKIKIPLQVSYIYRGNESVRIPPEPDLPAAAPSAPSPAKAASEGKASPPRDITQWREPPPLVQAPTEAKEPEGRERFLEHIDFSYTFQHPVQEKRIPLRKIVGRSSTRLWFDAKEGIPVYDTNHLEYLFFYQTGDVVKFTYDIQTWYRKIRKITPRQKKEEKEKIEEKLKEDPSLTVREAKEGVVVNMDSILFERDSDTLTPASREKLKKVAEILKQYPEREIRISGHTDSTGSRSYNQGLSERRARRVLQELVETYGENSNRLSYKGYGETVPLESNDTPEGRAKNRRVEFLIVME